MKEISLKRKHLLSLHHGFTERFQKTDTSFR
jgi:hypothetical protein